MLNIPPTIYKSLAGEITSKCNESELDVEYANIPLPGYLIEPSLRVDKAEIIDPRGFSFYISTHNLIKIMESTTITSGIIQDKCVFVRKNSDSRVELEVVTSPRYDTIVKDTELLSNSISIKDVGKGNTVFLKSKITGVYMGMFNLCSRLDTSRTAGDKKFKIYKKHHVFKINDNKFYHTSNPSVLAILRRDTITDLDAFSEVSTSIESGADFSIYDNLYSFHIGIDEIRHITTKNIKTKSIRLKKCPLEDILTDGSCIIADTGVEKYVIKSMGFGRPCGSIVHSINEDYISVGSETPIVLDKNTKFYKIVISVNGTDYF